MKKNTKPIKRTAGIPFSISLKPRPTEGNDLATDIFKAVKEEEKILDETNEKSVKEIRQVKEKLEIINEVETVEISETVQVKTEIVNEVNLVNSVISQNPVTRLFEKSKAKELYEILLNLTHNSKTPTDKVRVPRSYLMANTNIKTRITLDLNLKKLEKLGLIKITSIIGEQEGNIYQVMLEN